MPGGSQGVVRVGDTVRRAPGDHTPFVQALLEHLAAVDWPAAPRWLGLDDQGRTIVSFVEGRVPWSAPQAAAPELDTDDGLVRVAELTRELHDLTAGTGLAGHAEVVCHNDLAPRNTVHQQRDGWWPPVAFIDWDLAAPGERIHDVAHVCWQFVRLGPASSDPPRAAERLRLVCDAYGLPASGRGRLVDTILWWQDRCWRGIAAGAAGGDPAMVRLRDRGAVGDVQASYAWTSAHRDVLGSRLG